MDRLKHLKSRKDARLAFRKNQDVNVHCLTNTCSFDGRIENVSASGLFISTHQHLPVGEEIALSFTFPDSGNRVKATGKVARITHSGIGVEILVYFKEKGRDSTAETPAPQKQPRVIFLNGSNRSK